MENKTLSDDVNYQESECLRKCNFEACNDDYTLTDTTVEETETPYLTFEVQIPRWPTFRINHTPNMDFNAFFVLCVSSLGMWFGLSMIHLDPVKLYFACKHFGQRLKEKKATKKEARKARNYNIGASQLDRRLFVKSSEHMENTKSNTNVQHRQRKNFTKSYDRSDVSNFCRATRALLYYELRDEINYLFSSTH